MMRPPAWISDLDGLSPTERLVAFALYAYAGGDGAREVWPSTAALVEDTGLVDRTVRRAIGRLVEVGVVEDTGRRIGSTGRVRVFRLASESGPLARIQSGNRDRIRASNPVTGSRNPVTGSGNPVTVTGGRDQEETKKRPPQACTSAPPARPPISEAQRVVREAVEWLQARRDEVVEAHGLEGVSHIHPGAYDGEVYRALRDLRDRAHLPDLEAAARHFREDIERTIVPKAHKAPRSVRLLWPSTAFSLARAEWIAGRLGREAIDASELELEREKASQLPPGAIAARISGSDGSTRFEFVDELEDEVDDEQLLEQWGGLLDAMGGGR